MIQTPQGAKCELCGMDATSSSTDAQGVTHYYCEHHSSGHIPETKKGSVSEHAEHMAESAGKTFDKHTGHSVNMFRDRFALSLALTIPVVLYSELPKLFFGISFPDFLGSMYLPIVLSSIIFFYGGLVFIRGAFSELRHRLPGMMTLIALAITAAYLYSVAATIFALGSTLFWELTSLITIMLLGHWIEMKSVAGAQGALAELAKLLPDTAEKIIGDKTEKVTLDELKVGDRVLVRPGAKVPADGVIREGESSVNESMITGESKPIDKDVGVQVIAGTVNGQGALTVEVTKTGAETALAGIMRLVAEAQASRSRMQILADRAAFYLTIVAVTVGLLTLSGWLVAGATVAFAVERMVTVLVIACPHALGLAVPLVTSISTSLSARNGLLVRQRMALEAARNISVVLFDKTGTLTLGQQGVVKIWSVEDEKEREVLRLAASTEATSEHIIAKAIVDRANEEKVDLSRATEFKALPGQGVQARLNSQEVIVGGPQYLKINKVDIPDSIKKAVSAASKLGQTVVFVILSGEIVGAIALADVVRRESKQAVQDLHQMGIRVAMLTGDSEDVAKAVARELGLKEYFAEVLPEHKVDKVKDLQKDGSRVMMVGDGVNDAPALTQADVGVAIGAGTDVAIESAGIILVKNDPRDVVKVIRLSRATYSKMIQNLIWATGYNALAIPLAAGLLASFGIILAPAFGAILMSASTVIVATNAQFLRQLKLS